MTAHVFVVISKSIVIGKNSHRPQNDVQELLYDKDTEEGEVKCTYTTVPAEAKSCAVIVSRSANIWGCEMGTNDHDVVGFTVQIKGDEKEGLIPQDILRLSLGRSTSAASAVDLIGSLISNHGTETLSAYLLADKSEAWYLESVGKAWVAEKLAQGVTILPRADHIGSEYQKSAENLEDLAREKGWNGEGNIKWNDLFLQSADADKQSSTVEALMAKHFSDLSDFNVKQMTQVLRDAENGVSRSANCENPTAASQISILPQTGPACHWFTATPDPTLSVFKPFIFTPNARISSLTTIQPDGDGKHLLYRLHESATASGENKVISLLQEMEANCLNEVNSFMTELQNLSEVDDLLKDCIEAEVKFYK